MKKEVADKLNILVATAFGLVAALAWNGAIQAIFAEVFGKPDTIGPMIVYAIIVTIIAVIVITKVGKASDKVKNYKRKKKE